VGRGLELSKDTSEQLLPKEEPQPATFQTSSIILILLAQFGGVLAMSFCKIAFKQGFLIPDFILCRDIVTFSFALVILTYLKIDYKNIDRQMWNPII
jgi:hypothetical protein